jgi:hypothetical protein
MMGHHFEYNAALSGTEAGMTGPRGRIAARGLMSRLRSQSADEFLSCLIVAFFVGCGTNCRADRSALGHHRTRFNDRLEKR